jgi:hypothetical protein
MCDVLGFRKLAQSAPAAELAELLNQLIAEMRLVRRIESNISPVSGFYGKPADRLDLVQSFVFSDTILLYSAKMRQGEELVDQAVASCFFDVCSAVFRLAVKLSLPVRIGIAFGETAFSEASSVFVGLPIVWAHDMEMAQDWLGGACHESCERDPNFSRVVCAHTRVLTYPVPVHGNAVPATWALNWVMGADPSVRRALDMGAASAPRNAIAKYTAAVAFCNWVRNVKDRRVPTAPTDATPSAG